MAGGSTANTDLPAAPPDSVRPDGWHGSDLNTHTVNESQSLPSSPPSDGDDRRHSLPVYFTLPNLWSSNTSGASIAESSHGEISIDETVAAHRASALRQLNGAPRRARRRQRQNRSTGGSTALSSQPVIVRTYSGGSSRPHSHAQAPPSTIREEDEMKGKAELPPVEAFGFQGILKAIENDVEGTLDAIAEICAKSKYSLADEYGAHLPPQGDVGRGSARGREYKPPGSTLTAVTEASSGSERSVGNDNVLTVDAILKRTDKLDSAAYGSLGDVISKSNTKAGYNSTEPSRPDATRPSVEGRAQSSNAINSVASSLGPPRWRHSSTARSKSSSWASVPTQALPGSETTSQSQVLKSPINLISGYGSSSRHRTSTVPASEVPSISLDVNTPSFVVESTATHQDGRATPANFSHARSSFRDQSPFPLPPSSARKPSLFSTYGPWLPWKSIPDESTRESRRSSDSACKPSAEVRLRGILQGTGTAHAGSNGVDKGKAVERAG
ncbi:MAG: hypothetical protein M1836_000654 [Candelina mexicana]|nr:MAG: hypothetical protein M1836_000654 [Candelina mexicana]